MNLAVTKRCRHVFDVCPIHVAGLVAPLLGKTEVLLLLLRLILNIVEGIHIRGLARESAVVGCVDFSRGRSARVDERPSEQASTGVRLRIGDSSISNWVGVVPGYQRLAAGRPGISESVGGWTDDGPVRTASTRPGLFRPSRFECMHKLIYCRPKRRDMTAENTTAGPVTTDRTLLDIVQTLYDGNGMTTIDIELRLTYPEQAGSPRCPLGGQFLRVR